MMADLFIPVSFLGIFPGALGSRYVFFCWVSVYTGTGTDRPSFVKGLHDSQGLIWIWVVRDELMTPRFRFASGPALLMKF